MPESEVATGEGFDIIDDIIEKLWDLPPPPPPPPVRTQAAGTGDLDDVVHALSAWSQTANTLKSVSSARHVPVDAKPCPPKPTAAVPVGSAEYLRLPKSEVAFKFATGPDNPYMAPEMEVAHSNLAGLSGVRLPVAAAFAGCWCLRCLSLLLPAEVSDVRATELARVGSAKYLRLLRCRKVGTGPGFRIIEKLQALPAFAAATGSSTPDNAYMAPEIEVAQPVGFPAPKGSVAQHN